MNVGGMQRPTPTAPTQIKPKRNTLVMGLPAVCYPHINVDSSTPVHPIAQVEAANFRYSASSTACANIFSGAPGGRNIQSSLIFGNNIPRACLYVIQMEAHGSNSLYGIVCFDGADNRGVLAKTSTKERKVLSCPTANIETHVVEPISDPFENHIACGSREARMKAAI